MMDDDDHNIRLGPEEYDALIEALTNPPEPTEKLRELMSGVTDEMIEAGKAQFVAALIEGYPDNAGDGRVFARAYLAMKALDPEVKRMRETGTALLAMLDEHFPSGNITQRPTVAELEVALASPNSGRVEIRPDGSIHVVPREEIECFRAALSGSQFQPQGQPK